MRMTSGKDVAGHTYRFNNMKKKGIIMFKVERTNTETRLLSSDTGEVLKSFTGPTRNQDCVKYMPFAECHHSHATAQLSGAYSNGQ